MVMQYCDLNKLKHAKLIAKEHGCFVVEKGGYNDKKYLLYRECKPANVFIGRRSSVDGILKLVKVATTTKEGK